MARDYIPSNQEKFNYWFINIRDYVIKKTKSPKPKWNHIPMSNVEELKDAYEDWFIYYAPTLVPHAPDKTSARNQARRRAEKVLRPFVQRYLKWSPVTDKDRFKMGLPIRGLTLFEADAPMVQAGGDLVFPGIHMVEVRNIRPLGLPDDDRRERYDRLGIIIHYGILAPTGDLGKWHIAYEPRTGEDLPYSLFTRRKRYKFDFDGESGNRIFICLCYAKSKRKLGPFGPMLKAVIP